MKTKHDFDCHIYSSIDSKRDLIDANGICTCGYALQQMRTGIGEVDLYSKDRSVYMGKPMSEGEFWDLIESMEK